MKNGKDECMKSGKDEYMKSGKDECMKNGKDECMNEYLPVSSADCISANEAGSLSCIRVANNWQFCYYVLEMYCVYKK